MSIRKTLKAKFYRESELSKLIKSDMIERLRLEYPLGGSIRAYLAKAKNGYLLYLDDGGVTIRVHKKFSSKKEALIYAHLRVYKIALQEFL